MDDKNNNVKGNRSVELCRRTVTTESFIAEAKEIYGDRYDYSKVLYKNREHRVIVVCPIHGEFQVYAREHLDGKGCPKCEKGAKFVAKLKEKFGDKFGLNEFVYESSTLPVTLICPIHGAFSRLPHPILNSKCGCPECGNDLQRQFQEQLHQEAIDHKEERDLARKERETARREAKRQREEEIKQTEEKHAKERWDEKIRGIIGNKSGTKDSSQYDLLVEFKEKHWYENFFGLNLNELCFNNGTPIEGKQYVYLRPRHWPLSQMKVEAYNGELNEATFYIENLNGDRWYEMLLILEDIFSGGYTGSMEDFKEDFRPYRNLIFKFDGIKDGYKIVFNQWTLHSTIKIRKIKQSVKREPKRCNHFRDIEAKIVASPLPYSFVGIDFETLYPQRVSACSVGMVKIIDGKIVDRYYTPIRPPFNYPEKKGAILTWIHGFTEEMLKDERTFDEILPEVEHFVDGLPLVAHNACVERACIREATAYYGIETKLDYNNILDTLPLSKQAEAKLGIYEGGAGSHQLDIVCERFGIKCGNHHNALDDAEMCVNLMMKLQKILSEDKIVEVKLKEKETTPVSNLKYNIEDKVQRTDLDNVVDNPFKNQVVVLTGFIRTDSQKYAHTLNELGAIIRDGVNKKTNILITGYNAGPSKIKKAQEVGAIIMTEEEFKKNINKL